MEKVFQKNEKIFHQLEKNNIYKIIYTKDKGFRFKGNQKYENNLPIIKLGGQM